MGLFDFLKKPATKVTGSIAETPKRSACMVCVNPGSKVYHCESGGCGTIASDATDMTEKKAIALGLHRCKRCDWHYFDRSNGNA